MSRDAGSPAMMLYAPASANWHSRPQEDITNTVAREKVSNGPAEGLNSRIKMIEVRSRGFRNKERFANAIYFHLGGLNLYPEGIIR